MISFHTILTRYHCYLWQWFRSYRPCKKMCPGVTTGVEPHGVLQPVTPNLEEQGEWLQCHNGRRIERGIATGGMSSDGYGPRIETALKALNVDPSRSRRRSRTKWPFVQRVSSSVWPCCVVIVRESGASQCGLLQLLRRKRAILFSMSVCLEPIGVQLAATRAQDTVVRSGLTLRTLCVSDGVDSHYRKTQSKNYRQESGTRAFSDRRVPVVR